MEHCFIRFFFILSLLKNLAPLCGFGPSWLNGSKKLSLKNEKSKSHFIPSAIPSI